MPISDLANNLQYLCAGERSVSDVCRKIGLNRQQFARYLDGSSRPSPNNLRRICTYFEIDDEVLELPHTAFRTQASHVPRHKLAESLMAAFPGDRRTLRPFVGSYHCHYISGAAPDLIVRSLIDIREQDGIFLSRSVERATHTKTGHISRARFDGLVAMHGGSVFMVERGRLTPTGISQTIVSPAHRGSKDWLTGQLLGFSWRSRDPSASHCIWKRIPVKTTAREALAACGSFPPKRRYFEPIVLETFAGSW